MLFNLFSSNVKNVDHLTLKQWIKNGEVVLIDVREPSENAAQRIDGSKLIPLAKICCSDLPSCEGKKLVIHCHSGMRSASACKKLMAENPDLEVYNLKGGIVGWAAAGNKILTNN